MFCKSFITSWLRKRLRILGSFSRVQNRCGPVSSSHHRLVNIYAPGYARLKVLEGSLPTGLSSAPVDTRLEDSQILLGHLAEIPRRQPGLIHMILRITTRIPKQHPPNRSHSESKYRINQAPHILSARHPQSIDRHPTVTQKHTQLQQTRRHPSQPAIIQVRQRITKKPPLHIVHLRIIPIQNRQRLRAPRHIHEAVRHEARNGDVVAGFERD